MASSAESTTLSPCEIDSVSVSAGSSRASSSTSTRTVAVRDPGATVTVPEAAVKSVPAVAVPAVVA